MQIRNQRAFQIATLGAALALGATACGGGQKQRVIEEDGANMPSDNQDMVFEGFDDLKVEGMRFSPEALGRPGMLRMVKKTSIKKQQAAYAKASAEKKAVEGQVLATLLYDEAKKDEAKATELLTQARDVLREVHTAAAGNADKTTITMLSTLEVWLENFEGAEALFGESITRFPEDKELIGTKSWHAYTLIRLGRAADAAKVTADWQPMAEDAVASYVLAWTKYLTRDYAGARAAIAVAAQNWKSAATRPAVERDVLLFNSRGKAPVDEVAKLFADLSENSINKQYVWLYQLHDGYAFSGAYDLASAALDKALAVAAETAPPNDVVAFNFKKADYGLRSANLEGAAASIIAAWTAYGTCGDKCGAGDGDGIANVIRQLAQYAHTVYATSGDETFYAPARKLYDAYLALPGREDTEVVRTYSNQLDESKKNMQPNTGKHDKVMMRSIVELRVQAAQACYESVLASEPTLAGSVKATYEVDWGGGVTGVTTEPNGGEAGLAAVAACLDAEARAWRFPARTIPGKSAVVQNYVFSPKQ